MFSIVIGELCLLHEVRANFSLQSVQAKIFHPILVTLLKAGPFQNFPNVTRYSLVNIVVTDNISILPTAQTADTTADKLFLQIWHLQTSNIVFNETFVCLLTIFANVASNHFHYEIPSLRAS